MPSLNQAAYLGAAIESILSQQIEPLEIVIQDGGSTDGTLPLLQTLAKRFPRHIFWQSEPDSGPANAINKAVGRARGEILGWLNSDDLYYPAAIVRALNAFESNSHWQMLYGRAVHIDAAGKSLSEYPSAMPDGQSLTRFRDGCFICQPSAFVRKACWESLGGLDERYGASFDFDLWIRLFKAYSGQIGFLDYLQASSRLHDAGITLTQRERVATEGIDLLSRHFGSAPAHWFLTFVDEYLLAHPSAVPAPNPAEYLSGRLRELSSKLDRGAAQQIIVRLQQDRRMQLFSPALGGNVTADGWMPSEGVLRVMPPESGLATLSVFGRHQSPLRTPLLVEARLHGECVLEQRIPAGTRFCFEHSWQVERGRPVKFQVQTLPALVPALHERDSTDSRSLGFLVDAISLRIR